MDKNNKGLADDHDAEFILNESGTSVSNDMDEVEINRNEMSAPLEEKQKDKQIPLVTNEPIESNNIASDAYSRADEDAIRPFDNSFPDDKLYESKDAALGKDDV